VSTGHPWCYVPGIDMLVLWRARVGRGGIRIQDVFGRSGLRWFGFGVASLEGMAGAGTLGYDLASSRHSFRHHGYVSHSKIFVNRKTSIAPADFMAVDFTRRPAGGRGFGGAAAWVRHHTASQSHSVHSAALIMEGRERLFLTGQSASVRFPRRRRLSRWRGGGHVRCHR